MSSIDPLVRIASALEHITSSLSALERIDSALFSLERIASAIETQPLTAPTSAPMPGISSITFLATSISVATDETGKRVYRAKGDRFMKFGIRIWDEVFPAIGIDPAILSPGPNPVSLMVVAILNAYGNPKKIIGLANNQQH